MNRNLLPLLLCPALLSACSGDGRPAFASDSAEDDSEKADDDATDPLSGEGLIQGTDETSGGCGAVSVELEILRPNFYFVLDASESMLDVMPDSGGITRHLAARRAILDMLRAVGHRVNFAVALFPSPDSADGCEAGREVFELRKGEPLLPDGSDNEQLDALAFTLRKYTPSGATPTAPTLAALTPNLLALGPTALFLLTDGAPNCDLSEACSPASCIPNIEAASFEDGTVCDANYNCCAEDLFPHLCLDEDGSTEQLAQLAEHGLQSYVIGIPGSEVYADVLDAMAHAAGTAREEMPAYYAVEDADELALTLTNLGQQLSASCDFDLGTVPSHINLVQVQGDGRVLEQDNPNGWEWTGEQSIVLLGEACTAWRNAEIQRLQVFEGCTGQAR